VVRICQAPDYVASAPLPARLGHESNTVFPATSYLDEYRWPLGRSKRVVQRVVISVTSLSVAQGEPSGIRPDGFVGVIDHRIVTRVGPLTYTTTNAFIRPAALRRRDARS